MGEIQRPYDNLSMEMSDLANSIRKFNNEIEDLNDSLSLSKNEKSFDVKKYIEEYLEKEKRKKEKIKSILKEILIEWAFYFCFFFIILLFIVCCVIDS